MDTARQVEVVLELTADPRLLGVVRGTAATLALQLGFPEKQQLTLQEGVQKACQRLLRGRGVRELHLYFAGFSDRLEVVVENEANGSEASEEDTYLLMQLIDRIVVEETQAGKLRMTLVKYRAPDRGDQ